MSPSKLYTAPIPGIVGRPSYNNSKEELSGKNHLPINLFHGAAEYRKILITNGKSVGKHR